MNRITHLLSWLLVGVVLLSSCTPQNDVNATEQTTVAQPTESPTATPVETPAGTPIETTKAPSTKTPEATGNKPQSTAKTEESYTPDESMTSESNAPESSSPTEPETTAASNIVLPLPEDAFLSDEKQSVIGSIVQLGDGNAYVNGTVPAPPRYASLSYSRSGVNKSGINKHLVTFEHAFDNSLHVSGYIGNDLYIIQDHGSLGWNYKGVGHADGTVIMQYGEGGYFSISSMREKAIVVGNPTDTTVDSLWGDTSSYLFGYMLYDEENRTMKPLYEENNLRFYTAGYFINGVAVVSVKEGDSILFGIIDKAGNYVVEPKYEMLSDDMANGLVIVALEAASIDDGSMEESPMPMPEEEGSESTSPRARRDTCGRFITYSNTLMTNVQKSRFYKCKSQTVGLIDSRTGEAVLDCNYAYITHLTDEKYFVVDNEGNRYLYDADTDTFTDTAGGSYFYFNSDWLCYVDAEGNVYLADKDFNVYDASEFNLERSLSETVGWVRDLVNLNVIKSDRDDLAKAILERRRDVFAMLEQSDYNSETRTHTLTVVATGAVIENVRSHTEFYNGGFLYTVGNNLYRYDLEKNESTRIETGYGNYTEDYDNWNAWYHATVGVLSDGIFTLRYNIEYNDGGTSYHMVIVNDMGDVLFASAINAIERLDTNYLGEYDDALYSMAGNTDIEDNYFLTRDDGAHFLIQFVRGEIEETGGAEDTIEDTTRVVDGTWTFSLMSPFALNFTDGSEISVSVNGIEVPADLYAYDSETQSLKLFTRVFDLDPSIHLEFMELRAIEFIVTSGEETVTLRVEISPYAVNY